MPLGLGRKLSDSMRRLSHKRTKSSGSELFDYVESTEKAKPTGGFDPDLLASLPIGAEIPTGSTSADAVLARTDDHTPEAAERDDDNNPGSDTDSPAHSFASIDTISQSSFDMQDESESALEHEKNRRTRKLLKYSRWIRNRTAGDGDADGGGSSGKSVSKDKSVLALERKMARQEMKLDELSNRR